MHPTVTWWKDDILTLNQDLDLLYFQAAFKIQTDLFKKGVSLPDSVEPRSDCMFGAVWS